MSAAISEENAQVLKVIYYDPTHPAGFGGVGRLVQAVPNIPKKQIEEWLKDQQAYTLHRPARKSRYPTRPYRVGGVDHQWQADLMDMQSEAKHNDGNKYILTVIDVFSRYAWAEPCKTKSPKDVKPAFERIFERDGRKPFKIQTDEGLEFQAKTMIDFFNSFKIKQF